MTATTAIGPVKQIKRLHSNEKGRPKRDGLFLHLA
jgi:hypothetical protein